MVKFAVNLPVPGTETTFVAPPRPGKLASQRKDTCILGFGQSHLETGTPIVEVAIRAMQ